MSDSDAESISSCEKFSDEQKAKDPKVIDGASIWMKLWKEHEEGSIPQWRPTRSPQATIDRYWSRQASEHPGRVIRVLPKTKPKKRISERRPSSVANGENAIASYEQAARRCRARVQAIVKECRRLNHKYTDPDFDLERDEKSCLLPLVGVKLKAVGLLKQRPGSVKRVDEIFDHPTFFDGPPASSDIRQGSLGNCWVMSALCALSNKPGTIEKLCVARDEEIGVYGFVFNRDGDFFSEIVDDKLFLTFADYDRSTTARKLFDRNRKEYDSQRNTAEEEYKELYQRNSGALYFGSCQNPNSTWLPLLEKAFAKAHGDYNSLAGGFPGEAIEDFSGGVTTDFSTANILDKEHFWSQLLDANEQFLFTCDAGHGDENFVANMRKKGIAVGHAYTIKRAVEIDDHRLVLVRNPWGCTEWTGPWSDGSKEWTSEWMLKLDHQFGDDGLFWIAYEDLLHKYSNFSQTRLFDDDWQVAQKWTGLDIPWAGGEHKTKFSFTLSKKSTVVVVLSKLDDRYFAGFQGRYCFALEFFVRKVGETRPIARTYEGSISRRSQRVELTLETGTYEVIMIIGGQRGDSLPVESILLRGINTQIFQKKLLRLARSYETAHARGRDEDSEEERKFNKKATAAAKAKDLKNYKKDLMKAKRQLKHSENRKKRKARAAKQEMKNKKAKKTEDKIQSEITEGHEVSTAVKASSIITRSQKKKETKAKKKPSPLGARSEDEDDPDKAALYASEDIDDDSDINSDVSEISDNEVEELFIEMSNKKKENESQKPSKSEAAQNRDQVMQEAAEGSNMFELDPWNAFVVVGLRVYSKLSDVTLEVIRPEFEESDSSDADEEDEGGDVTMARTKV